VLSVLAPLQVSQLQQSLVSLVQDVVMIRVCCHNL